MKKSIACVLVGLMAAAAGAYGQDVATLERQLSALSQQVATLQKQLEEMEAKQGRYIFSTRQEPAPSNRLYIVRFDTQKGEIAFLNDVTSPPQWDTLIIPERTVKPTEGLYYNYLKALKNEVDEWR